MAPDIVLTGLWLSGQWHWEVVIMLELFSLPVKSVILDLKKRKLKEFFHIYVSVFVGSIIQCSLYLATV